MTVRPSTEIIAVAGKARNSKPPSPNESTSDSTRAIAYDPSMSPT
jgi:hypothetical protein